MAHHLATGELYDLERDPGEIVNLWDRPEYREVKAELLVRLCGRMAETIDPLPPTEAPF